MKTINILKDGTLLPPAKGLCQSCAVDHVPEQAHNKDSFFYQMWFKKHYGRWPTWKDAVKHCPPHIKKFWKNELAKHGISI